MKKITLLLTISLTYFLSAQQTTPETFSYSHSQSASYLSITNVSFTGTDSSINNTTTWARFNNTYAPNNDYTSQKVSLDQGTTSLPYSITGWTTLPTLGPGYPMDLGILVDLNQNGSYDSTELLFTQSLSTTSSTAPFNYTGNLTLPSTLSVSDYNIRVIIGNFNGGTPLTTTGYISYGEIEVYTLAIAAAAGTCNPPTSVAASNILQNTATISFTAATGNDSYSYTVYSGTDTTATPFQSATDATATEISNSAISLSGLTANSQYTVVITASCSATPAISDASVTFTTLCNAESLPYSNSFESGLSCFTNTSTTPWLIGTAATGNEGANPTTVSDGSSYVYFDDYNYNAGSTADLITPPLDMTSITSANFTFDYFDYSATQAGSLNTDTIGVYVVDATGTYNLVLTTDTDVSSWTTQAVDISSYTGQIIRIAFRGTSVYGYSSPSIDNLVVAEGSLCDAPTGLTVTNITDTTATYTWTADLSNTSVSYVTTDSTGATVASASGTASTTVDVTGLSGNTTYTVTLTGVCGSDSSATTTETSFTTPCSAYSIPFSEGFETGYTNQSNIGTTGGNGNACYTEEQVGTSAYYAYAYNGTAGSFVTPNSGSWSGFAGTNATNIWYFFDVALTGGVSYTAGIYARASSALSSVTEGSVAISYGASASAADMTTQIVAPSVLGTTYQQTTGEFTPTSDGTYTIGVNVVHDGAFGGYLNFDDISIIETPDCSPPTEFQVTTASYTDFTTATMSWTAHSSNDGFDYNIYTGTDTTATPLISSTATADEITAGSISLSSLTTNTTYTAVLTGTCGSSSSSSVSTTFTTNHLISGSFSEDFNSYPHQDYNTMVNSGSWYTPFENNMIWASQYQTSVTGVAGSSGSATDVYFTVYSSTAATSSNFCTMTTPYLDISSLAYPRLSLSYHMTGSVNTTHPLSVTVLYSDGLGGETESSSIISYLGAQQSSTSDAYSIAMADLSPYIGVGYIRIKITGYLGATPAIDDFKIEDKGMWIGSSDTDWSNALNWSDGIVPSSVENLTLNSGMSNYPVIADSNVTLSDVNVNSGASLTISGDASLTADNIVANSGNIILNSDASSSPSLIVNTSSRGDITYNRYAAASRWYITSSPVSGQDIDSFILNEDLAVSTSNTSLVGLADYNNDGSQYAADPTITTGWWQYHQSGQSDSGNFTPGKGKIVRLASDATDNLLGFTGTIGGSVSVPLTVNTTAFNLIGNPYPAAVQVTSQGGATNDALSANSSVLSEETAWFWNGANGGYTTVNQNPSQAAKITAPGQGFFVSAAGSGNFSFTKSMQTASTGSFNRQTEWSKIDLSMSAGTQSSETDIVYFDGATTGWDNGYDSTNMGSESFQIFTSHVDTSTSQNLAIQSLPLGNFNDMVVPVGVNASAGQTITISVDTTNWPEGVKIYLEDVDNGSYTLLDGQNAEFTTLLDSNESGIGRFYIHTTSNSLGDDDLTLTDVSIYASSRDNLRILGINSGEANVQMFDLMGKQVLNTSFNGQSVNDVKLPNLNTGIYLVNLASDEGTINKKIIIQ